MHGLSVFQNFSKRCLTTACTRFAKNKNSKCSPPAKKKPKPKPKCTPVVEVCKKIGPPPKECVPPKKGHPEHGNPGMWKFITCFFCLPLIAILSLNTLLLNEEKIERPEFKQYDYMRIRIRPFPWGDGNHTLFHNPCVNALPEGYEEGTCDEEILEEIQKQADEQDPKPPCKN